MKQWICGLMGLALLAPLVAGDAHKPSPVVVAHFGDSTCITTYLPREQRVDRLLNERLAKQYPGQEIVSHNLGANGDTIRRLLDSGRYQAEVKGKIPRLDMVLIRYGHNDRKKSPPEEFKKHLVELCDRLLADYPGVKIVLETNTYLPKTDSSAFDRCWQAIRELAKERAYPLVDNYARRKAEADAGKWDQCIRNQKLSQEKFGKVIMDDSRDAEMKDVPGWFSDAHPNPPAVAMMADEEFKVISGLWPTALPVATSAK